MSSMTPLERVVAALTFKKSDRVPVALYFQSAAQHDFVDLDYTWEEGLNHPRKLFQSIERQYTEYGADNFFLPVDFRVEGEALGSKLNYMLKCGGGMRMGVVSEWVVKTPADLAKLSVPDPTKAGRMPVILEVIRRTEEEISRCANRRVRERTSGYGHRCSRGSLYAALCGYDERSFFYP